MKKFNRIIVYSMMVLLLLTLTGCNKTKVVSVEDCKFRYNETDDNYTLNFSLMDEKDRFVVAEADVEMWVVNDDNEIVFSGKRRITEENFKNYNLNGEDKTLAEIVIEPNEVDKADTSDGVMNFYVNGKGFDFYDCKCDVNNQLPLKDQIN